MKIVIDIPIEHYNHIVFENNGIDELREIIRNGTPLPKGHGRLIDADELSVALDKMAYMDSQPRAIRRCIRRIKEEPTIIQASESDNEMFGDYMSPIV